MIPIRQTKDNCMTACMASILEVSIDDLPDYQAIRRAGDSWLNALNTALSKHHGCLYMETDAAITPLVQPVGWHLINVGVPAAGDGGHAIVGYCGRPLWNPTGRPIVERDGAADTYGLLVPLDDELRRMWAPTWSTCLCPPCVTDRSYVPMFEETMV